MIPSVRPLRPLLLVLLLIAPLSAAWAATTVVTAARMIDVLTGRVIEQPQIVITDERITEGCCVMNEGPGGCHRPGAL